MNELETLCSQIKTREQWIKGDAEDMQQRLIAHAQAYIDQGNDIAKAQQLYTGSWKSDCQKLIGISYQTASKYVNLAKKAEEYLTQTKQEQRLIGIERFLAQYRDSAKIVRQAVDLPKQLGCVYVLSNIGMPSLFKIGHTYEIHRRLYELSQSTAVPFPFKLEWELETTSPRELEQKLHTALAAYRVNPNKEFFMLNKEDLFQILEEEFIND